MPDLPPRAVGLAVVVQVRLRARQHRRRRRHGADEVEHRRPPGRVAPAERQPARGPDVVGELADVRALDRPVPRVVDPWGHLVRQQPRPVLEPLDRQHADVIELGEDAGGVLGRPLAQLLAEVAGRGDGPVQDAVAVLVPDERITGDRAVPPADGEDGQLAVERDEPFEDERPPAERLPRPVGVGGGADHRLPLPVVPEPPRLQHRRQADGADGGVELVAGLDRGERRGRDAEGVEERLLDDAVLRHLERPRRRRTAGTLAVSAADRRGAGRSHRTGPVPAR